jgi:hypothetical protein
VCMKSFSMLFEYKKTKSRNTYPSELLLERDVFSFKKRERDENQSMTIIKKVISTFVQYIHSPL